MTWQRDLLRGGKMHITDKFYFNHSGMLLFQQNNTHLQGQIRAKITENSTNAFLSARPQWGSGGCCWGEGKLTSGNNYFKEHFKLLWQSITHGNSTYKTKQKWLVCYKENMYITQVHYFICGPKYQQCERPRVASAGTANLNLYSNAYSKCVSWI